MTKKGRYPDELRQEDVSRAQFGERLHQYGWVCDPILRDTGEDLYVRIFHNGNWSGLTFMVQLKSRSSWGSTGESAYVSQRVDEADLEHWEGSALAVFVVAWNVEERKGHWVRVTDAIAELDNRRPQWRGQRTTTLRLPSENTFDDSGIRRIRDMVARESLESVRRGRNLHIQTAFQFPKTPEGDAAREALEHHFATGVEVVVDGQFIKEVKFSDWWNRLFPDHLREVSRIKLAPRPSSRVTPVRLDMMPDTGPSATIGYVEMRQVQGGTEERTFANQNQRIPLLFTVVLRKGKGSMSIGVRLRSRGADVAETLELLNFIRAIASGGTLLLSFLQHNQTVEVPVPRDDAKMPPTAMIELLEDYAAIQHKTGVRLQLPEDREIPEEGVRAAKRVRRILEQGRTRIPDAAFTMRLERHVVEAMLGACKRGEPLKFTLRGEGTTTVLGKEIPLGPMTQTISARLAAELDDLRQQAEELGRDDKMEVRFYDGEIIEEFADWVPSNDDHTCEIVRCREAETSIPWPVPPTYKEPQVIAIVDQEPDLCFHACLESANQKLCPEHVLKQQEWYRRSGEQTNAVVAVAALSAQHGLPLDLQIENNWDLDRLCREHGDDRLLILTVRDRDVRKLGDKVESHSVIFLGKYTGAAPTETVLLGDPDASGKYIPGFRRTNGRKHVPSTYFDEIRRAQPGQWFETVVVTRRV